MGAPLSCEPSGEAGRAGLGLLEEGPERRGPRANGTDTSAIRWQPDPRLPERADFPLSLVREALEAERSAEPGQVFKGAQHINSVVRIPGSALPVVVRRKAADIPRREPGHLSEHAVLGAIERAGVPVAAPRVLALGRSEDGSQFAVHTYVGPSDVRVPPRHPVDGLTPREAVGLVDQLAALAKVDHTGLHPATDPDGTPGPTDARSYHGWLVGQLAQLVDELPEPSRQCARRLGFPDGDRLRRILSCYTVADRRAVALLHGDLNPWNLVGRDDGLAVTVIDWEMAAIGDPLHELVRHMHLTPTRPEIRDLMFRRWEEKLPERHTADWRRDWRVYRWIEIVRSAYVDLDRQVTGASLDAPNVRRAVDGYAATLKAARTFFKARSHGNTSPVLTSLG